ncbi:Uu.00g027150.m01.CDS01 [Anthostomella pinea]|uniref:Uu.00g027150.m01.CDS01 n=1 Tax=Anthostomella pinea TaxID=933095 RepID=A0AAI8YCN8_9PEZI|nr:Uu.00g027150.m01.CDS01 [Anthostomella pinea]
MGLINPVKVEDLDALIIGAGFSGVYQLKRLREEGYKAKLVDSGSSYGGIWHWNRYPGARVDSHAPHYQFSDAELWNNWHWKQRFPAHTELRAYFDFVADKWDLTKDTYFETYISSAFWDESQARWFIQASDGRVFRAQFFLPNTGIAAKRSFPSWKGLSSFKGTVIHSSYWPHEEPDLVGKKVAMVGTGSTGVQIAQSLSTVAAELVVFQRTPAMAIPMKQVDYQDGESAMPKDAYPEFFKSVVDRFFGLNFQFVPRSTFDDDDAKRRATYESLWQQGDFAFWLGCYSDMPFNRAANHEAYKFWREKIRARIHDPRVRDMLAPEVPPHPFGCKRVPLENGYYEIFNKPNVQLVDINHTPVVEVTAQGLKTTEQTWDVDVIVLATGFDAVTGGLTNIDIRGVSGRSLREKWQQHQGPTTNLGISVAGFPNMFFSYGPQAPTAFCNGPTCAEFQGDWIVGAIKHVRDRGLRSIVASEENERAWGKETNNIANATLLPQAKSWYMGDNIPDKPRSSLMYFGGVPSYYRKLEECASNGYAGFHTQGVRCEEPVALRTRVRREVVYLASTFAVALAAWEIRFNWYTGLGSLPL